MQISSTGVATVSSADVTTTTPILLLPCDILHQIFHLLRPPTLRTTLPLSRPTRLLPSFVLSHVCHTWRTFILSTPSLWPAICLGRTLPRRDLRLDIRAAETWVQRVSGDIGWEAKRRGGAYGDFERDTAEEEREETRTNSAVSFRLEYGCYIDSEDIPHLTSIVSTILPLARRWKHVEITLPRFAGFLASSILRRGVTKATMLDSLVLRASCAQGGRGENVVDLSQTEGLKYVCLEGNMRLEFGDWTSDDSGPKASPKRLLTNGMDLAVWTGMAMRTMRTATAQLRKLTELDLGLNPLPLQDLLVCLIHTPALEIFHCSISSSPSFLSGSISEPDPHAPSKSYPSLIPLPTLHHLKIDGTHVRDPALLLSQLHLPSLTYLSLSLASSMVSATSMSPQVFHAPEGLLYSSLPFLRLPSSSPSVPVTHASNSNYTDHDPTVDNAELIDEHQNTTPLAPPPLHVLILKGIPILYSDFAKVVRRAGELRRIEMHRVHIHEGHIQALVLPSPPPPPSRVRAHARRSRPARPFTSGDVSAHESHTYPIHDMTAPTTTTPPMTFSSLLPPTPLPPPSTAQSTEPESHLLPCPTLQSLHIIDCEYLAPLRPLEDMIASRWRCRCVPGPLDFDPIDSVYYSRTRSHCVCFGGYPNETAIGVGIMERRCPSLHRVVFRHTLNVRGSKVLRRFTAEGLIVDSM